MTKSERSSKRGTEPRQNELRVYRIKQCGHTTATQICDVVATAVAGESGWCNSVDPVCVVVVAAAAEESGWYNIMLIQIRVPRSHLGQSPSHSEIPRV